MALVLGTNCGFVTEAPTGDLSSSSSFSYANNKAYVSKYTSPIGITKITEMGWWCDDAFTDGNFEVGLYAADGAGGIAGTRLYVDDTNAKGADAGWKTVTVDWEVEEETPYWLGFQFSSSSGSTSILFSTSGGEGIDYLSSVTSLSNPFGGGTLYDADGFISVYAVYEAAAPAGTNQWINVDDAWRQLTEAWVNVDDSWRKVKEAWINVDDVWRQLYSV